MKKIILGAWLLLLTGCSFLTKNTSLPLIEGPRACFQDVCFSLEIADDTTERRQGLMGRTLLAKDAGMFFIFPDKAPRRKFWMKNTLISLDMIWLDDDYRIVHLEQQAPPCTADPCPSYGPDEVDSKYVIELNGGMIEQLGSEIGDKVDIYKE